MSDLEAGESVQLHSKTQSPPPQQPPTQQQNTTNNNSQKSGNVNNQLTKDREERLRLLKEKQNEERLRKLEELKQQAVIAQKFREQKEEERRRRIEELRLRDSDKRQQVVERKRQIWEVERDRREAILRKNQEREARIETKKRNERSSIMFAFGSSTPRMLEPADTGGTYWASRRATSTNNVMTSSLYTPTPPPGPLTRRSSERELSEGNKKRATSAGGLLDYRSKDGEEFASGPVAVPVRTGAYRRKTDLMPTIPSSSSCRDSRTPGSKSGDTTPSRPPSACSSASSVRTRPQVAPRRPRPASIAVTGVTSPLDMSSSRHSLSSEFRNATKSNEKPPLPKVHVTKKPMQPKQSLDTTKKTSATSAKSSKQSSVCSTPALQSPTSDLLTGHEDFDEEKHEATTLANVDENKENVETVETALTEAEDKKESVETSEIVQIEEKREVQIEGKKEAAAAAPPVKESSPVNNEANNGDNEQDINELNDPMSQSMIAEKKRIATEDEAKAALAERRRLMREQQEREAELERQAQEAARLAEIEAQRREEEEQKKLEEESLRLIEEAKKAEEARLLQAIQEAQQREEDERKRKEEEQKQKLEREELERKAKEEAEKQRIEMEIRLKKEEEERQARKKRVEAIMLRTRGKGSATNTPNKEDSENNLEKNDSTPNNNDTFSDLDISSKENESNGFNHTNGHHNGFSEKNNEQNVVSNTIELNSHESKANVDLLDLGIPTIIPTETNVNNVNNYNNSQVTDLLS